MAIKSILSSYLITLIIPLASIASPSGKFRPAACEINQRGPQTCQVKHNYLGRMEYLEMTIRWPDGTITKLKKPTSDSSVPWTDYFGREWVEGVNEGIGADSRFQRNFVNMRSRIQFRLSIFD